MRWLSRRRRLTLSASTVGPRGFRLSRCCVLRLCRRDAYLEVHDTSWMLFCIGLQSARADSRVVLLESHAGVVCNPAPEFKFLVQFLPKRGWSKPNGIGAFLHKTRLDWLGCSSLIDCAIQRVND